MNYSKIVYFLQLSHKNQNAYQNRHHPLAIGILSEFLKRHTSIDNLKIKLYKDPIELEKDLHQEQPDIIFISIYMWNENLSLKFAEAIKERYNSLIVIGGPNISIEDKKNSTFLKEKPFIDIIVRGDGEKVVTNIVENFYTIDNINKIKQLTQGYSYASINSDIVIQEGDDARLGAKGNDKLDILASPYNTGSMDKFFIDGSIPLIETNRGCPFSCTYCQQGNKYFSKVRNYSMDYIKSEIEYIAKKIYKDKLNISILEIADPNFAMYERDTEFILFIRQMQDKYNFPEEIWCSTGKNKSELIVSNINLLRPNSILMRAAVQSVDENTLKAIKRKNIKLDTYYKIMTQYSDKGLATGADIMLGLPLENKQTHINSFFTLIDKNITEFASLQTILLKGTEMESQNYIEEYNLKTKYRVIPECNNEYTINNKTFYICEYEEIIIETNSLDFLDYLECRAFNFLVMVYHNTRLLQPVYKLCDYYNIPKSHILKEIKMLITKKYTNFTAAFIEDTKNELLDSNRMSFSQNKIKELTSNKIFRHLALTLFQNKNMVIEVLKEALPKVFNKLLNLDEVLKIVELSIIDIFDSSHKKINYKIKDPHLQEILGMECDVIVRAEQINKINLLKKIYDSETNIINNIMYHLRPKNSVKTLRFVR